MSLAVLYLLLGAEFIAMAQIIVYAGAIMVLFVFVIMLLNTGGETAGTRSVTVRMLGLPALLVFVLLLCYFLAGLSSRWRTSSVWRFQRRRCRTASAWPCLRTYLLPFEVTSVLILIAILGAIVLARKEID